MPVDEDISMAIKSKVLSMYYYKLKFATEVPGKYRVYSCIHILEGLFGPYGIHSYIHMTYIY